MCEDRCFWTYGFKDLYDDSFLCDGEGQVFFLFIYFLRFYLFIHERERQRQAEGEAGSIPGLQDHTLSQSQMLNH